MSLPEADVEKIAAVPKAGSYKEEGIVTHHTDGTVHRSVSGGEREGRGAEAVRSARPVGAG